MGRLDPSEPIDVGLVFQSKLSRGLGQWDGVKLLGDVSVTHHADTVLEPSSDAG
jgi:hypothetical protein